MSGLTAFDNFDFGTTDFGSSGGGSGTFAVTGRNQFISSPASLLPARPPKLARMEKIVRPFVLVGSAPKPTPVKRDPLPGEDTESYIEWGGRSNFIISQLTQPIEQEQPFSGVNVRLQPDKDKEKKDKDELVLTEYSRSTKKVKVVNPENEENWVMVERIQEITFTRSDGGSVRMKFTKWK